MFRRHLGSLSNNYIQVDIQPGAFVRIKSQRWRRAMVRHFDVIE